MTTLVRSTDRIQEVSELLQKLDKISTETSKEARESQKNLLQTLKLLGQQVEISGPIFQDDGIRIIAKYGLDGPADDTSRESLKCLANALFLNPKSRQLFADQGHGPALVTRLENDSFDDEFLCSRILFLLTYDTRFDFELLIEECGLDKTICSRLQAHAKIALKKSKERVDAAVSSGMATMALVDLLKLLFNLTHYNPHLISRFSSAIPSIFAILESESPKTKPPLEAPVSQLINALLNFRLVDAGVNQEDQQNKDGFHGTFTLQNVEMLLRILDAGLASYPAAELNVSGSPLVNLLRICYANSSQQVSELMQDRLLPTDEDREKPLGQSPTTFGRLIKLSGAAVAHSLRDSVSGLLFELSNSDVETFVQNVGFGYASGFLANNGLPTPDLSSMQTYTQGRAGGRNARGNNESVSDAGREINPITGQFVDAEPVVDEGPPMTDEEKEREAEKMFVLFERLKATGVVDVENPVTKAAREGKLD